MRLASTDPTWELVRRAEVISGVEHSQKCRSLEFMAAHTVSQADERIKLALIEWDCNVSVYLVFRFPQVVTKGTIGLRFGYPMLKFTR